LLTELFGIARNEEALVRHEGPDQGRAKGPVEQCKLPQRSSGHSPDCKCILDALRAQKMRLVASNVV